MLGEQSSFSWAGEGASPATRAGGGNISESHRGSLTEGRGSGEGEEGGVGQASKVRKLYGDSSRKWGGKGAREGVWREGICVRTCV